MELSQIPHLQDYKPFEQCQQEAMEQLRREGHPDVVSSINEAVLFLAERNHTKITIVLSYMDGDPSTAKEELRRKGAPGMEVKSWGRGNLPQVAVIEVNKPATSPQQAPSR